MGLFHHSGQDRQDPDPPPFLLQSPSHCYSYGLYSTLLEWTVKVLFWSCALPKGNVLSHFPFHCHQNRLHSSHFDVCSIRWFSLPLFCCPTGGNTTATAIQLHCPNSSTLPSTNGVQSESHVSNLHPMSLSLSFAFIFFLPYTDLSFGFCDPRTRAKPIQSMRHPAFDSISIFRFQLQRGEVDDGYGHRRLVGGGEGSLLASDLIWIASSAN